MIKILFINGGILNRGGIEMFMFNYISRLPKDMFEVDILVHGYDVGSFESEFLKHCNIIKIPTKKHNIIKHFSKLKLTLRHNDYDIIHSNLDAMSLIPLYYAKKYSIKNRIAHSHNTRHLTNNPVKIMVNHISKYILRLYGTDYFACSNEASEWLFGKRITKSNMIIIKNAIESSKYLFDDFSRQSIRIKHKIDNKLVIGHIGRFDYQKNHEFLINIFHKALLINENLVLVLIGDGDLRKKIENMVLVKGLKDKVIFLGQIINVNEYINCFDLFALPSHFEGLGIVAIEAQYNGLKCLLSSNVPEEVDISRNVEFIDLDNSKKWIREFSATQNYIRNPKIRIFNEYDINMEAKRLEEIYVGMCSNE